jgi:hypothetical protein
MANDLGLIVALCLEAVMNANRAGDQRPTEQICAPILEAYDAGRAAEAARARLLLDDEDDD